MIAATCTRSLPKATDTLVKLLRAYVITKGWDVAVAQRSFAKYKFIPRQHQKHQILINTNER